MTRPHGLIHPRTYLVLFYRRDVFSALGLAPPDTWEQLLQLATNTSLWSAQDFNSSSTDLGQDGTAPPASVHSSPDPGVTLPATHPAPAASLTAPTTGLCLALALNCTAAFLLQAIWASVAQYTGAAQGLHFDPLTMQPLVTSPAMTEAVRLYTALGAAAGPDALDTCGPLHPAFLAGTCAITVGWDHYFTLIAGQPVSGRVGVAPLPGSTRVWDRQASPATQPGDPTSHQRQSASRPSGALKACTGRAVPAAGAGSVKQSTTIYCPHASLLLDGSWVNRAPLSQFFYFSMRWTNFRRARQAVTDSMLNRIQARPLVPPPEDPQPQPPDDANQAISGPEGNNSPGPSAPGALATAQQTPAPAAAQTAGQAVFVDAGCGLNGTQGAASNALPCLLLPRDGSHPPDADLSAWLAHQPGLHPADSQLYFRAVWYAKWHPNLASDINTYYGEFARAAFMKAAYLVLVDPPNQTASTLDEVASIYAATVEGTRRTSAFVPMDLYWQTIGYTPPPAPPLPSTVNASATSSPKKVPMMVVMVRNGLDGRQLAAAVATPLLVFSFLLASAAVLVYMTRQRQCHRTLLGGVLPPGVAPATTFLVTDIQDSTLLWEALPVEVMDITIALHHAAIRQCLANFCGYEVITEGERQHEQGRVVPQPVVELTLAQDGYSGDSIQGAASQIPNAADFVQGPSSLGSRLAGGRQNAGGKWPDVLLLCGPRLRMGLASGLDSEAQRSWNKVTGRKQYTGPAVEAAKRMCHACPGGLVFLAGSCFKQLAVQELTPQLLVVHMANYLLEAEAEPVYLACMGEQLSRLLVACPIRCLRPMSTSLLEAPCSRAAVVYLTVVGLGSLTAWDSQVAGSAVALCHTILDRQLHLYGGYCVEQAEAVYLATFCHPHTAIRWALACIQLCLVAAWPQQLLEHVLGEEAAGNIC
ncbi:hypothetical protein V8C86DRAFT_3117778 [Haematococcus lacustris]